MPPKDPAQAQVAYDVSELTPSAPEPDTTTAQVDGATLPRRGKICLVANDFDGIVRNGGIGTYFYLNAILLAKNGWNVHVLYTSLIEDPLAKEAIPDRLNSLGIKFVFLDDIVDPNKEDDFPHRGPWFLERSDKVRHALKLLHAEHRFDLIEFSEWQGMGFRTVQSKRNGQEFLDVDIVVRPHSCSQWVRDGNLQWINWQEEVRLDYCERYAFENADVQLSPSAYMLEYLRSIGWNVRSDAAVSFYPFPDSTAKVRDECTEEAGPSGFPEIVFFGRLEVRKGLELFLDSLKVIDPRIPITFLGKNTQLADGTLATDQIEAKTEGRSVKLITDYNRQQALDYVTTGNKVVVIASLVDNLPFTVIECLVNRVPFIASDVGGIPELVQDSEARKYLLFEPTAKGLQLCLKEYLSLPYGVRQSLHSSVSDAHNVLANRQSVFVTYTNLLASARKKRRESHPRQPKAENPLVTVGVPYYNLPEYLPETLASLAAQTYENLEVVVVNDGSTDPAAVELFEEMANKYPDFRFVTQVNSGIGAARNRALAEAQGEYFIPVDADNIAHPRMVETFLRAMQARGEVSALTCYFKAFRETEDIAAGKFAYFYRPSGGPHFLGSIDNVFGDANAIFRTEALRSVNGYETERTTSWEDWECFVKLSNAGHTLDVLPEFLFYYRHRDESWMRVTSEWRNHRRVLRQYFETGPHNRAEAMGLWNLLLSMVKRVQSLERQLMEAQAELDMHRMNTVLMSHEYEQARRSLAYRIGNRMNKTIGKFPYLLWMAKAPFRLIWKGKKLTEKVVKKSLKPVPVKEKNQSKPM